MPTDHAIGSRRTASPAATSTEETKPVTRRRVLRIGAASAVAGGLGTGLASAQGETSDTSSMTFNECDIQVGIFEFPAELAAGDVPPGFEPTSLLEPEGPTASFVVDAHACKTATSDGFEGSVRDVGWVTYVLGVDPPERFKKAGERNNVDHHRISLAAVADSTKVVDAFDAWNLAFEEGTAEMEETDATAVRSGQFTADSDSVSSTLHTAVSPAAEGGNSSHRGWSYVVKNGEVTCIVEFTVTGDTQFLGGAERIDETPPSDPEDVPFWTAKNPATRGAGAHFDVSSIDIQPLDPETVTKSN